MTKKKVEEPKKILEFDATKYKWEKLDATKIKAFGISCAIGNSYTIKDVEFDRDNLKEVQDSYDNGTTPNSIIYEYAAILLNDDSIIFCLVEGKEWGDTFNSGEKIEMEYYKLTTL